MLRVSGLHAPDVLESAPDKRTAGRRSPPMANQASCDRCQAQPAETCELPPKDRPNGTYSKYFPNQANILAHASLAAKGW